MRWLRLATSVGKTHTTFDLMCSSRINIPCSIPQGRIHLTNNGTKQPPPYLHLQYCPALLFRLRSVCNQAVVSLHPCVPDGKHPLLCLGSWLVFFSHVDS